MESEGDVTALEGVDLDSYRHLRLVQDADFKVDDG